MSYSSDPALQSNQLPLSIDFPQNDQERIEVLTASYKRTVDSMNYKIGGLFSLQEVADFERWFTIGNPQQMRNGYRKTFHFLGNALTFAHGIKSLKQVTDYRAIVYTDNNDWRKVPYTHVVDITKQISMQITETDIIITNGGTAPAIISGIAVIEYLKQG